MPERIRGNCDEHTNANAQETQPSLPQVEAVDFPEYQGERAEKEVEDAQQDAREQAQVETHRLEEQQEKGAIEGA